jgi:hypothetical protein
MKGNLKQPLEHLAATPVFPALANLQKPLVSCGTVHKLIGGKTFQLNERRC